MFDIALLGGGFDPISLHHEKIVDVIYAETGMPVWVMPCYGHLFPKGEHLTDAEDRLAMVRLTCVKRDDLFFVPCAWEIWNKHTGSMYETVARLKSFYSTIRFHIVIGMDNANVIETQWDRGNLLIQENPFFVLEREGVEKTADWFLRQPHRVFQMDYNLSSTAIREAIQNGNYEFAQSHLNPLVWKYIKNNGLYGYKA